MTVGGKKESHRYGLRKKTIWRRGKNEKKGGGKFSKIQEGERGRSKIPTKPEKTGNANQCRWGDRGEEFSFVVVRKEKDNLILSTNESGGKGEGKVSCQEKN